MKSMLVVDMEAENIEQMELDLEVGAEEIVVEKKQRKKSQWCSAINCCNDIYRRPDLSFFRFPKDEDGCRKWVVNTPRQDLITIS